MAAITPKTELQAVNLILRNMKEAPVNSLSGTLPLDASKASATLSEVSEDVQSRGWYFNTEYFKLSPDSSGYISLPANTLSVSSCAGSAGIPVEHRSGKLYNMTPFKSSFVFSESMYLELVLGLDFSDLPPNARRYIAIRAARVYQVRQLGDQLSSQEDSQEEQKAYAELLSEQLRKKPVSLNDSYSVAKISRSGGDYPLSSLIRV